MKVLIFSSKGFLGKSITNYFEDSNFTLLCLTRNGKDNTHACDLSNPDPEYLKSFLDNLKPDCIINSTVNTSSESDAISSQMHTALTIKTDACYTRYYF